MRSSDQISGRPCLTACVGITIDGEPRGLGLIIKLAQFQTRQRRRA